MDLSLWKRLKKEQRLTFDALAEKSNIPKRTLEDIFAGRTTDPRTTTVEAIERALGINEKSSPAGQESVKIPDALKPYQYAFFEGMDGLSEESIKDILRYVDFVKSKEDKEKNKHDNVCHFLKSTLSACRGTKQKQ